MFWFRLALSTAVLAAVQAYRLLLIPPWPVSPPSV